MRPVNLIPAEERSGSAAPLRTGALPYVLVGVLGAALLAVFLVVSTNNTIVERKDEIAQLESREQAAQQKATALAPYAEFSSLEQAREATISSLASSRFDWSRVMNELALVTPSEVWLTQLTATAGVDPAAAAAGTASGESSSPLGSTVTGPSISLTGCAPGQQGVADYISDLESIDGVTRVGVDTTQSPEPSSDLPMAGGDDAGEGGAESGCGEATSFSALIAFDDAPAPADPTVAAAGTTDAAAAPATDPAAPATGETTTPTESTTPPAAGGVQ